MIFFCRNKNDYVPENGIKLEHKIVYNELGNMKEEHMKPVQKFLSKSIKYKGKTEAEFEKRSYGPGITGFFKKEKSTVPGTKIAAKKAFPKDDRIHEDIEAILSLTFWYEDNLIDYYIKEDKEKMLNIYDAYSKEFENKNKFIKKRAQKKGSEIVAAVREVENNYLRYHKDVYFIIEKIRKDVEKENKDIINSKNRPEIT